MKNWDHCFRHNYLKNKFKENYIYQHFKNTFDALNDSYVDTWDIQWVFACLSSHGLCLTPAVNLISNIGVEGTHGSGLTDSHFIPTRAFKRIQYKEAYPSVRVNYAYDIALHGLKNKKAVRTARIRRILKRTKLLNFAKSIRRMFRLILR